MRVWENFTMPKSFLVRGQHRPKTTTEVSDSQLKVKSTLKLLDDEKSPVEENKSEKGKKKSQFSHPKLRNWFQY